MCVCVCDCLYTLLGKVMWNGPGMHLEVPRLPVELANLHQPAQEHTRCSVVYSQCCDRILLKVRRAAGRPSL